MMKTKQKKDVRRQKETQSKNERKLGKKTIESKPIRKRLLESLEKERNIRTDFKLWLSNISAVIMKAQGCE